MQSIAEEVVSSSGGGGKYITSGFSAYNGHSAIGFGIAGRGAVSSARPTAIGIGILQHYNEGSSNDYWIVDGTYSEFNARSGERGRVFIAEINDGVVDNPDYNACIVF